jgi:hypothetical protein
MSKFYGQNLSQGRDVRTFDPLNGWIIRRPFRGTPPQMALLRQELQNQKVRYEDEQSDGGYETVWAVFGAEATQPEQQELVNAWDLDGNDVEKDIWYHPKVVGLFFGGLALNDPPLLDQDGCPTDVYVQHKRDLDDLIAGTKVPSDLAWWPRAFITTKKFVRALLRGVTAYPVSEFVLRNTLRVAANYSPKLAYDHVHKVFTTPTIKAKYSIPGTIKFVLPEGFWMEKTPRIQQRTGAQWELVREWIHAETYDDFLYDPAT